MGALRNSYRIIRSVLLTIVLAVIALYVGLYVVISIPAVQQKIKTTVEKEVSGFLGGRLTVGRLDILPFNELRIADVRLYTPEGEECAYINKVGAGISLFRLWKDRKIVLTYAEIIGLDARVWQNSENGPMNIQFIIDAVKPKDKNKPPTKFDVRLYNVVIRKSGASFDRRWKHAGVAGKIDFNHLRVDGLKADISLPRLSNDEFKIDVRRLALKEKSGLDIENITLLADITPKSISISGLKIKLPFSEISPSDIKLEFDGFKNIRESIETGFHTLTFSNNIISLPDFKCFFPPLAAFTSPLHFNLAAEGNANDFSISGLSLETDGGSFALSAEGYAHGLLAKEERMISLDNLKLEADGKFGKLISDMTGKKEIEALFAKTGRLEAEIAGSYSLDNGKANVDVRTNSQMLGDLDLTASGHFLGKKDFASDFKLFAENIDLAAITSDNRFGELSFAADGNVASEGRNVSGDISLDILSSSFNGYNFKDIKVEASKHGKDVAAVVESSNEPLDVSIMAEAVLDGAASNYDLDATIRGIDLYSLGLMKKRAGYILSGNIKGKGSGNNLVNGQCDITLSSLAFRNPATSDGVSLKYAELKTETDGQNRFLSFYSDWADGYLNGAYTFAELVPFVKSVLHESVPAVVPAVDVKRLVDESLFADYYLKVKADNPLLDFLGIPFQLGSDLKINGKLDNPSGIASLYLSSPYIIQNKKKVIKDTELSVELRRDIPGSVLKVATLWPVKNGSALLDVGVNVFNNNFTTDLGWNVKNDKGIYGSLSLEGHLEKDILSNVPDVDVVFNPSEFYINNAKWNVDHSRVVYTGKDIKVDALKIWHDGQYVLIDGSASADPENHLSVSLRDIDLNYIFNTLNINYVTFGGIASGELTASSLFSKSPVAKTERLFVKDLSYNGAVLGDAEISSHLDNEQMEITIDADVRQNGERTALIEGGIWVTRDSLSFDLDANKVNVAFLKPFMAAFSSDIKGKASGKAKLYGTFKDIDLIGRIKADTLALKLDFTNVYYSGSDSVILNPGHIEIPSFRLHDKYGHTAILKGNLRHRYFHEPEFEFRLQDADRLLCYDTNSKMNPDWYGTIYGNGSAVLRGRPGYVGLTVDMTTAPGSNFTFVLNDNQVAQDYDFLTFSDRRKEELEREKARRQNHLLESDLKKKEEEGSTVFSMDLRGTVMPSALMTLVMDPKAGDKITAHGNGALQIGYDTETDEMSMYGKYTLEEGSYNFSLQDLILKDFTIRPGSSISFNGDPLAALLNITATYRVNTNLSDLDKSFASDKELNRTNVPVDAVLKVDGDMRDPNISLDIDLPTLTAEMARKVRSIISTEDMMNRQIIYLLALNKFYTPEYMGGQGNGGELASVASSTLSSQLSNMISQLTNKFTLAPSFRSDKGDFSDMEVDVALSSRLLDNRLLINGNFGYRDRSTSQTTFIGDFDIEYLLNRNGNLRLKAYNHFNDQNYYLKSSLTTQGIGIIYRRDFDNPFTFLKRRRPKKQEPVPADSVGARRDSLENERKGDSLLNESKED